MLWIEIVNEIGIKIAFWPMEGTVWNKGLNDNKYLSIDNLFKFYRNWGKLIKPLQILHKSFE